MAGDHAMAQHVDIKGQPQALVLMSTVLKAGSLLLSTVCQASCPPASEDSLSTSHLTPGAL